MDISSFVNLEKDIMSAPGPMTATASASSSTRGTFDPEQLNDRQLFEYCQKVGLIALKARREFIGLLPLAEKRRIYEGHGFYSVYDFASKVGGIGREIVTEVLRLDVQLRDFPLVRKLLYGGKVGWSKIRMIAHWVTVGTQKEWIEKLGSLSYEALAIYLRDFTAQKRHEEQGSIIDVTGPRNSHFGQLTFENPVLSSSNIQKIQQNKAENFRTEISEYDRKPNESQMHHNENILITGHRPQPSDASPSKLDALATYRETFTFSLQSDIAARLRLFRQKLERERRELITWEEVMVEFLKYIEFEKQEQKGQKSDSQESKKQEQKNQESWPKASNESRSSKPDDNATTRHIPMDVQREVLKKYDNLCAFRDCAKPAEILHHTRRFSLTSHLPAAEAHSSQYIKPLCKNHERIVHNTLIANEDIDPSCWKLLDRPDSASSRYQIDQIVSKYRKPK